MSTIVHRPRLFTPPAEDFAQLPPARDSWQHWSDADDEANRVALAEARAWRSIAVTTRDEVLDVAEGAEAGLVDRLIVLAHDAHRHELDELLADGLALADTTARMADRVVWVDGRVVAVLRPLPGGALEVAHFEAEGFLDARGGGR